MDYWLGLFTGTTWQQFRLSGATVIGFRARQRRTVASIPAGDVLLCYLTGVKHWVGALKVAGPSDDSRPIWTDEYFSERLAVEPMVLLNPEHGIPLERLRGRLDFYKTEADKGGYRGFLRTSPNRFRNRTDGDLILQLLHEAANSPLALPVDPRQLARRPTGSLFRTQGKVGPKTVDALVSVPEPDEPPDEDFVGPADRAASTTRHTEIQFRLLQLGAEMGLDVWVARNDRSRSWKGRQLGQVPRMASALPAQFNEVTQRTIELIDVLWLKGNSIVAAFEVECTTAVYSGLLRMSDLLALQPNLDIKLYLVAPDERRDKVAQEIRRPTFAIREKPLTSVCGYLPFGQLSEKLDGIERLGIASSLDARFLETVAEYFTAL